MEGLEEQRQELRRRNVCVVIPAYNNGGTIRSVVEGALAQCDDVIVVNDGSTDDTARILHAMPRVACVEYARNRGKGYALKQGFARARDMGFAYAITLDADGQHYPSDIGAFLQAHREHPAALIVGNRNLVGVDRSKGSSFANRFSNFWFYVQTGERLSDTQTGYRLYPLKPFRRLWWLTSRYEAELELLVWASWHKVPLHAIPIEVYYPPREERVSHFRPVADFMRITLLNTVLCLIALPMRIRKLWLRQPV